MSEKKIKDALIRYWSKHYYGLIVLFIISAVYALIRFMKLESHYFDKGEILLFLSYLYVAINFIYELIKKQSDEG